MKPTSISAEALFEAQRELLHWEWIAGHAHPERRFDEAAVRVAHRGFVKAALRVGVAGDPFPAQQLAVGFKQRFGADR